MPTKPPSRCPRCKQLHAGIGTCASCKAKSDTRPSAARRGYGTEHRDGFRLGVLAKDPVCVLCHRAPSTHADHWPRDRRELEALGLDPNDPQYGRGLCASCDSTQTAARQPGGINRRAAAVSDDIESKVERSSLGTADAKAARSTIPDSTAAKAIARAAELRRQSPELKPEKIQRDER